MFDIDNFEIPASVIIKPEKGSAVTYRVFWIKEFKDKKQIGETDYDAKHIVLKQGLDKATTFWTFFHEMEHALSEENGLKVTEKQVNGLEIGFSKTAELNGWVKTKVPTTKTAAKRKKCQRG